MLTSLASLGLTAAAVVSPQDWPQELVGQPAPTPRFEAVLDGERTLRAPAIELKGRVTLLEFWFTTCGPCRQAVPHLNDLVRAFAPRGLQAYAVTFETADAARAYLQQVAIAAPVAIDTARATIRAYGVSLYPTAVLVGRDGTVLACTSPHAITGTVLADALAGRPVKVEPPPASAPAPAAAAAEPVLAALRIAAAAGPGASRYSVTPERIGFEHVALPRLLQYLHGLEHGRFELRLQPDDRLYDVELSLPGATGDRAKSLLEAALAATFHLSVRVETRELDVAVFRKPGKLVGVTPWDGKERGATGNRFRGASLATIVDAASSMMGVIGIDETGDTARYDFTLDLDESKPVADQVRERFGLAVAREKRRLPFTTIEQAR